MLANAVAAAACRGGRALGRRLAGGASSVAASSIAPSTASRPAAAAGSAALGSHSPSSSAAAMLLIRGLSTAPPKPQQKGGNKPTHPPSTRRSSTPTRISAALLDGQPPATILELLKQKCQGGNRPRLSDLHALLEAARRPGSGATKAGILEGVGCLLYKNVEFREETASLFLRAMCRADALGEAVDLLLDRSKRLGLWTSRKTAHMALLKLGQAKDAERLQKFYEAMEPQLGVARTARSVHLAVRGLVDAGLVEEAAALAAEAGKGMALADSTKEIVDKAKAKAAAAAAAASKKGEEEKKPEAAEGKEAPAAAAAAAPEPKK